MKRLANARRSLNAWGKAPAIPSRTLDDLSHFPAYLERRAVAAAVAMYIFVLGAVALLSDLIWGNPPRIAVGLIAIAYWPVAWFVYLRHHYKAELGQQAGPAGGEPPNSIG